MTERAFFIAFQMVHFVHDFQDRQAENAHMGRDRQEGSQTQFYNF